MPIERARDAPPDLVERRRNLGIEIHVAPSSLDAFWRGGAVNAVGLDMIFAAAMVNGALRPQSP
jgi:hypothetical protein